jgi:hypothetical protein
MNSNIRQKIAPFGLRHEIAKRYPPIDWIKSRRVAKAINNQDADFQISTIIRNGQPALVGRLGGTEARFLGAFLKLSKFVNLGMPLSVAWKLFPKWRKRSSDIHVLSGFYFDSWIDIRNFVKLYLDALANTDILGAWGVAFTWIESRQFKDNSKRLIPVGFTAPWIEPYSKNSVPWCLSLSGKRVLVISGFSETFASQHKRISHIFIDVPYPKFELTTIKAPLVSGLRDPSGKSWFELLDEMKEEIQQIDFDIALIAAGAFSYPLADFVKTQGKIGIHCGGGLQLFFGVMGNRWNNSPEVLKFVNEFWVRPSPQERPKTADSIEDACYW